MKIDELSSEQIAAMPATVDTWLGHGLATSPADRAEAEAGVAEAYQVAGLEPPRVVIWLDLPMAGAVGAWLLTSVGAQVGAQVGDQVRAQVRAQVYRALWGQHDAGWLAFYHFFRTHCAIEAAGQLTGLMRVAKSAGWWWPFTDAVILTERPNTLHRDAQGRLHHETGPALTYPDGFAIWAWHGTRVPRDLIETGWNTSTILREPNTEIRRCAIERLGWDQFIADAGLQRIGHPVPDPGNPGHQLALYDVPEQIFDEPVRVLLCENATSERDGTRRRFGLTVPSTISDPITAAAWTFGLGPTAYAQLAHAS